MGRGPSPRTRLSATFRVCCSDMPRRNDVRTWLRQNGYDSVAAQIDQIMESWRKRGVRTNRNWWEVLAGEADGTPRLVEDVTFPVLAAVRKRQGLERIDNALENTP